MTVKEVYLSQQAKIIEKNYKQALERRNLNESKTDNEKQLENEIIEDAVKMMKDQLGHTVDENMKEQIKTNVKDSGASDH